MRALKTFSLFFLFTFSTYSYAEWLTGPISCAADQYSHCRALIPSSYQIKLTPNGLICGSGENTFPQVSCDRWNDTETDPCDSTGQVWVDSNQACYTPPDCSSVAGSQPNSDLDSCECPSGQTEGYTGTVSDGLTKSCVPENPEPDPDEPECSENSSSFIGIVNGQPYCGSPECPDGYNSGYVNGQHVCISDPNADPNDCPEGTSYGEFKGVSKCWGSTPNIDDPDYPPNLNGGNSPLESDGDADGDGQAETKGNNDDSRVVGRLDAINDKLNKSNSSLDQIEQNTRDTADSLEEIADSLTEGGDPLPDHTETTNDSVSSAAESYRSRIASSPIVSTFSGFKNLVSVSNASCPELSIDLSSTLGQEISTTMHCDLYDVISAYLTTVMLIIYSFMGFRIFASA